MVFGTINNSTALGNPGAQILSFVNNYNSSSGSDVSITEIIPIGFEFIGSKQGSSAITYTLTYSNAPSTINIYKNGSYMTSGSCSVIGGGSTSTKVFTNSTSGAYSCSVFLMSVSLTYTIPSVATYLSSDTYVIYLPITYSLSCSDIFSQNIPTTYGTIINCSVSAHSFSNMAYYTGSSDETGYLSAATTRNLSYSPTILPQNITNGFCYFNSGNFKNINAFTETITSSNVSSSTSTGALVVSGGIGVAGAINTSGNINSSGVLDITNSTNSSSISTGCALFSGGVGISGNVFCGGIFSSYQSGSLNWNTNASGTAQNSISLTNGIYILSIGLTPNADYVYMATYLIAGKKTSENWAITQLYSGNAANSVTATGNNNYVIISTNVGSSTAFSYSLLKIG